MKKILAIAVIVFSITVFFTHAQEQDPWELVDELATELEASTQVITELRNENETLEQEKSDLTDQLEETTDELEASTELIIELRNELTICQNDLSFFREEYRKAVINDVDQDFGVGLGMAYPIGAEAIATFRLPFLQIVEVYGRVGFNDTTFISAGGGVIINF